MEWIGKSYNPSASPTGGYFFSLWGFLALMGIAQMAIIGAILSQFLEMKQVIYINIFLQGFLVFALPAWLVEKYYRRSHNEEVWRINTRDYLMDNTWWMLLLFVATAVSSSVITWGMEQLPVPSIFKELEELTSKQYEQLISERDPLSRIFIWLGTVVAAPFGEELFFRGALMGWLLTKLKNKHLAIVIVALIFSLVHMQWTGFPGRFLIGLILGYVAVYGGLWMAILFHFLNNFASMLFPELDTWGEHWWLIIITAPAMILLIKQMRTVAVRKWATSNTIDKE